MSDGKFDEMKGRVKKAGGDLTDNDELRREGQADETAGKAKQAIDKAKDRASDAIDAAKDAVTKD